MNKRNLTRFFSGLIIAAICVVLVSSDAFARKKRIVFGGGPAGGTFQVVANGIQVMKSVKASTMYSVKAQTSGGATENLRKTNSGRQHFSTTYSGIVWQARNGLLAKDTRKYTDVLAVAWLYGAPAQLVVKKDSGIKSVKDLAGKKVGVGNAGSGAFANCQLFFTHMGVWDKIERNAMGYNDAAAAFGNNQLDAFWLFTAFPSGAVIMAAQTNDIALLDLAADAKNSGFFKKYPYFGQLAIPAGTYRGVNTDSPSFQDSALWVANSKVDADVVYDLLTKVYSDEGIKHMHGQKKTFKNMSLETGSKFIITPFHPGAERFWKEKGML